MLGEPFCVYIFFVCSLQLVSRLLTVDDLLGCIADKPFLGIRWNSICAGDMPFVVCGDVQYINKNCYKASFQSLPSVRAHLIVFCDSPVKTLNFTIGL